MDFQKDESNLDHTSTDRLECIHDIRMVRPPQAPGNENFHKLAPHTRDTFLMGRSLPRILRTSSGQQNRLRRKRRSVQPHAAQSNPGSDLADSLHSHRDRNVQRTVSSVEPFLSLRMPHSSRILRIFKIKSKKVWRLRKNHYLCNPNRKMVGSYNG